MAKADEPGGGVRLVDWKATAVVDGIQMPLDEGMAALKEKREDGWSHANAALVVGLAGWGLSLYWTFPGGIVVGLAAAHLTESVGRALSASKSRADIREMDEWLESENPGDLPKRG